jgi:transposase
MLTREEDYAHQQPSLTARKLRMLEVIAGQPTVKGQPTGVFATHEKMRHAERALAEQAEASYKRMLADYHAAGPAKETAGAA